MYTLFNAFWSSSVFIHEFVMWNQSQYQSRGKLFAGAKSGDIRVYQDKMINGSGKKWWDQVEREYQNHSFYPQSTQSSSLNNSIFGHVTC